MEESGPFDVRSEMRPVSETPTPQTRSALVAVLASLIALAALAISTWIYVDTRRTIDTVNTDIAKLRVGIELLTNRSSAPVTDSAALTDLSNRLAILEEDWRNAPVPTPVPTASIESAPASASAGDCLPTGTRFLVAAGDSYPVCGVATTVEIGGVDNGFVTLRDGTIIAAGGNIALPGTSCMIGVVSAGEDGMIGFAEIRVTC